MKHLLWKIVGADNYTKYRHRYLSFVENKLLGNREVYYSQMGEDMILKNLFQHKRNGFFVDVGAYHPVELSNTYYFYKKGWRGINIDATPGSMKTFGLLRPKDTNLEIGVAEKECEMDYYLFDMGVFNTFSPNSVEFTKTVFNFTPKNIVKTKFLPLCSILDKYLPPGIAIDFISVDVEGADELVLRSNNWEKYKPKVVCVERHTGYDEFKESDLFKFLEGLNYHFAAKSGPSYFFYLSE